MVTKVAGGIIGLGLIGAGGVAFVKPEWLGINKEITWKPLSEDSDYKSNSNAYDSKFGEAYKYYLVGATENQDWWKESFERLKKDSSSSTKPSDQFKYVTTEDKKITDAFAASGSNGGDKALNQICKKVYKETTTNIKPKPADNNASEYKEADVWKYCSGLGQKPTTVKEVDNVGENPKYKEEGGTKPIGKEKEDSLISVTDEKNNKFWEIRDKEFRGDGHDKIEDNDDAFFASASNKGKKIKDICEIAYSKPSDSEDTSTADKPAKAKVTKYCSLDKQ